VVPLSAVLITHDEEARLPAALESVRFCDEVVVVDDGSTDRTREIAEQAGARVVVSSPWPGFAAQKNRALDEARHDWVLAVDADERVAPALREEIEAARAAGFANRAGYRVPRVTFYLGRWIRGTDWYPDWQLRLFDRRRGRWQGALVHESARVDGPVGRLRGELEHFPYADIASHVARIDRYTTLWARGAHEAGRRSSPLERALAPGFAFLRNYVLRGGFRLGWAGYTVSRLNAHYTFLKLAKLAELERGDERARR
jgi:glycosyltransferase involved in cell wall biosynthesis